MWWGRRGPDTETEEGGGGGEKAGLCREAGSVALTWTDGRERTTWKEEREDQIRQKTRTHEGTKTQLDIVGHWPDGKVCTRAKLPQHAGQDNNILHDEDISSALFLSEKISEYQPPPGAKPKRFLGPKLKHRQQEVRPSVCPSP